jgi:hypothetical protein
LDLLNSSTNHEYNLKIANAKVKVRIKLMLRPTVSRSVYLGVKQHLAPRQNFCYCQAVANFLMWGAIPDERTDVSFTIAACPRQRSHNYRGQN